MSRLSKRKPIISVCLNGYQKSRLVEDSIGQAYIQIIRAADRFIYIENQVGRTTPHPTAPHCTTPHHIAPHCLLPSRLSLTSSLAQYFLGSAFAWAGDRGVPCHHTVAAEITEKICEKVEQCEKVVHYNDTGQILAGEQFLALIVIPLHPDGDPATAAIQEILAWQRRTMQMMYAGLRRTPL